MGMQLGNKLLPRWIRIEKPTTIISGNTATIGGAVIDKYVYTVSLWDTGEILFRGCVKDCADFLDCGDHYVRDLSLKTKKSKANTRFAKYKVERISIGNPRPGGSRRKDLVCCDCGKQMKNVGANRQRCPECSEKHALIQNREYMRGVRGIKNPMAPIPNPNIKYCEGCVYLMGGFTKFCHYIFVNDRSRPCPPGKDCKVKVQRSVTDR